MNQFLVSLWLLWSRMDITPVQSICGWINLCLKFETFIDEFMSTIIVKSAGPQLFTSYFFFRSLVQCCPKLKCLCVLLCIPNIEEGERGYLTKGNSKAKTIKLEDLPNCFCLGLYLSIPHGRSFKHHPFRLWFCFPDIQISSFLYILSQDTL